MSKRSSILLAAAFVMTIALVGCGSEKTTVTEVDTVAPAAVLDLAGQVVVDAGLSVELGWAPSAEPDLAAYNIYRSVNGGDSELVGVETSAAFSDGSVVWGTAYTYEVSAIDTSLNESTLVSTTVVTPTPQGSARESVTP